MVSIPLRATGRNLPSFNLSLAVTFGATETVKVVTLSVQSDSVSHIGSTIEVGFDSLPTGIMRATGSGRSVTVTVVDDDFNYTASYADQVFSGR